jgi:pilus assembly protein CpaB
MSSTLRLSIIMVLLLATAALGLIAYNNMNPKPVVQVTENTPAPPNARYFVAAHPLPVGTLARDEDFRSEPLDNVPPGAFRDTPDARIRLRGSLVRKFLDTDSPVTSQDVLRPGDRGFLASILAPGKRAISINVDAESGVSWLIRPGDYVDVVLTQEIDKADLDKADLAHRAYRTLSETVLHNVRIIAIDQEIVQGGPANNASANNATAGKPAHPVSLELEPEQVKKIAVAKHLGTLSLAIQAKVEQQDTGDTGTFFSRDVSPEIARQSACQSESAIARQSATVGVYARGKLKEYVVKKHGSGDTGTMVSCDGSPKVGHQSATAVDYAGDNVKDYAVKLPEKQ